MSQACFLPLCLVESGIVKTDDRATHDSEKALL